MLPGQASQNNHNPKVAVIGGGPTGMALALALHAHGIAAEIFEARTRQEVAQNTRVLALSDGSRQILEWLNAWPSSAATAIGRIHISHQGGLGRTLLHASELKVPALGYVLPASDLINTLDAAVNAAGIAYVEQTFFSRDAHPDNRPGIVGARKTALEENATPHQSYALTAWAEGAVKTADTDTSAGLPISALQTHAKTQPEIKTYDYAQHAIICQVYTVAPHHHMAWERFTEQGPVALLPLGIPSGKAYAVVLTCPTADAAHIAALPEAEFLALLQARFGTRHRFVSATPRDSFSLGLRYRQTTVGERQVWLGNAAQTLHPVAGQGFNLALRDVWALARTLQHAADPGNAECLSAYAKQRALDRRGAMGFTHGLINLFSSNLPLVQHARGAGLLALDLLPGLKQFVARRMMYGARAW
jgi:2-octaprenyl-6-methoxyphenol hydroxylase